MNKFNIVDDGRWHIDISENKHAVWSGNKDLTNGTVYLHNEKDRLMVSYIETFSFPSVQPCFSKTKMQLTINGKTKMYETRTILPTVTDKCITTAGITVCLNELSSSDNKKFFELDGQIINYLLQPMHILFARILLSKEFANITPIPSETYSFDNYTGEGTYYGYSS